MIFLSHNYQDKPIIEQFALAFSKAYGQDQVFYDSWSIQPGEGIIERMGEGLAACKFFLFFVSANSINSPMVKLEWQNALIKAAKKNLIFLPIRVDASHMPILLTQTVYIDLYGKGLDVAVRQTMDVVSGKNTYSPPTEKFSNLHAHVSRAEQVYDISIVAEFFMEPITNFGFCFTNQHDELSFEIPGEPAYKQAAASGSDIGIGTLVNSQILGLDRATTPGHPFVVRITVKAGVTFNLVAVMHEQRKNEYFPIKLSGPT